MGPQATRQGLAEVSSPLHTSSLSRAKPRPAPPLMMLLVLTRRHRSSRCRLLDLHYFERSKQRREIGVAGYENNDIGLHLDRKLERVDRHHHVYVRLVTSFLSWRPIFGHNHESVGAQPLHELIFLVAFFLPDRHRGRKSGINHHLDQLPSGVGAG